MRPDFGANVSGPFPDSLGFFCLKEINGRCGARPALFIFLENVNGGRDLYLYLPLIEDEVRVWADISPDSCG